MHDVAKYLRTDLHFFKKNCIYFEVNCTSPVDNIKNASVMDAPLKYRESHFIYLQISFYGESEDIKESCQ